MPVSDFFLDDDPLNKVSISKINPLNASFFALILLVTLFSGPMADTRLTTTALAAPQPKNASSEANQRALDAVRRDRRAILSRRAREGALIASQRKIQVKAAHEAARQARKARYFSARSRQAETDLDETERRIKSLTREISALTIKQETQRLALTHQNIAWQTLLPVALQLARHPDTSLITFADQSGNAARGLSLIAGLTRLTIRQADDLRGQRALLDETARRLAERSNALSAARKKLAHLHEANVSKMAEATRRQEEAESRAKRARDEVAAAAAKASTLEDALAAIDRTQALIRTRMRAEAHELVKKNRRERARDIAKEALNLTQSGGPGIRYKTGHRPVAGKILTAWHQNTESGPATGMTYEALPASAVTAPCAGQVDFAGPFRTFGNMIILNCGRHYRFVLSGLYQLSVTTSQRVGHNAALGTMSRSGGRLFVQLRAGSKIIDPTPYL